MFNCIASHSQVHLKSKRDVVIKALTCIFIWGFDTPPSHTKLSSLQKNGGTFRSKKNFTIEYVLFGLWVWFIVRETPKTCFVGGLKLQIVPFWIPGVEEPHPANARGYSVIMSQHWLGVSLDVTAQRTPFPSSDPPQCRRSRAPSGPPHRSTPRRPPPPPVWDCQMDRHIPPRNMLYWYRTGFFGTVCHCHRAVVSKSLGTENRHCCRLCDTNYIFSLYSSKFIIYLPPLAISVLFWLSCIECGVFRNRWFWRKVWGIGAHKKSEWHQMRI